ncbi:hypothetical protein COB11_08525 [Candidatus Aerophobetes bacterium]|uniref:Uncharacterized protein n=1 Tax=Aerophobetes bacterium TaxID=2030807 RepID=A0A2A4Y8M4_UNCAE|nr:MAG: hypothetical protein COB11_08525 [Candidatus Aerophobetes bacterium]
MRDIFRELSSLGLKVFTNDQAKGIATQLGYRPEYVAEALFHLLGNDWVVRIKKGVYGVSVNSGLGSSPHEFERAMSIAPFSAISHWTAMHYHHMTQQTPNIVFASTSDRCPRVCGSSKSMYHFIKVKKEKFFGIENIWIDDAQVQITDPEKTLLDGLISPQYCGDFQEVFHAFKMFGDQINVERIVEYALMLDHATIKRLGWVLDALGYKNRVISKLLRFPIKGYRKLDASAPAKGIYNSKWMIQENIGSL